MYKLKDVMEMLDIPERTIRRHIKDKLLQGNKVGGIWFFTDEQIGNYLSNETIRITQKRTMVKKIIDYTNGFSQNKNDVVISINSRLLTKEELTDITSSINVSKHPFQFTATIVSGKHNIMFIGQPVDANTLMKVVGKYNEWINQKYQ